METKPEAYALATLFSWLVMMTSCAERVMLVSMQLVMVMMAWMLVAVDVFTDEEIEADENDAEEEKKLIE
jgi:hypothetical protein